jgi:hypothetical protein
MSYDAIVFDAVDKEGNPIYHTNVMMSIGLQIAIVCFESIREEIERKKVTAALTAAGKIIVDISLEQVTHFAGNMLEVKSRNGTPLMIMSSSARNALTLTQETTISTFNRIIAPDLQTIETVGGGSARCMLAEIFY